MKTTHVEKLKTVEGIEISPSEAISLETLQTETITSTNNSNPSSSYSIKKPLTYKNDFGGDFGYFDEYGYYYNGCYFHYEDWDITIIQGLGINTGRKDHF